MTIKEYLYFNKNKLLIIIIIGILGISIFSLYKYYLSLTNTSKKIEKKLVEDKKIFKENKIVEKTKDYDNYLVVDIKGEINKPGVYQVLPGERINDLIKKAGGLKLNADTSYINLAKKLKDEEVIVVYSKHEVANKKNIIDKEMIKKLCQNELINNGCIGHKKDKDEKLIMININTASKEELIKLKGLGEVNALKIIEYRQKNKFNKIEDIKNVPGIGEALFAKIKENITV